MPTNVTIRSPHLPREKTDLFRRPVSLPPNPGGTPKANHPANRVAAQLVETRPIGIARLITGDANVVVGVPVEASRPAEEAVNTAATREVAGSPHEGVRDPDGPDRQEITVRK